jgi:hypothetical protein
MELTQRPNNVREIRMQLWNEFSDRILELNKPVSEAITTLEAKVDPGIERLDEAQSAYEALLDHIRRPFVPPTRYETVKEPEGPDDCLRLFHFMGRGIAFFNDRERAIGCRITLPSLRVECGPRNRYEGLTRKTGSPIRSGDQEARTYLREQIYLFPLLQLVGSVISG